MAVAWLATLTPATVGVGAAMLLPPMLVGVALGSETDILAYFGRRLFGLAHYAVIYNRLLIGYFLGTMAGPLVLGWAFDHLAQPRTGLWVLAASCGLATVVALALPPVRHLRPAGGGPLGGTALGGAAVTISPRAAAALRHPGWRHARTAAATAAPGQSGKARRDRHPRLADPRSAVLGPACVIRRRDAPAATRPGCRSRGDATA